MTDTIDEFRHAMRAAGLEPPDIITPGKLHRFPGCGKGRGNTAAWCKLFADGRGGVYGDHSSDLNATWHAYHDQTFTATERAEFAHKADDARADERKREIAKNAKAKTVAEVIWNASRPAPADHPYLLRKQIRAHGARLYPGTLDIGGMPCNGALVIPLRVGFELWNLQFIAPDGNKRFLRGGRTKGSYASFGSLRRSTDLLVAEGWATAATLHEATGYPVVAAMSAGNLEAVAVALRNIATNLTITICADDDTASAAGSVS